MNDGTLKGLWSQLPEHAALLGIVLGDSIMYWSQSRDMDRHGLFLTWNNSDSRVW